MALCQFSHQSHPLGPSSSGYPSRPSHHRFPIVTDYREQFPHPYYPRPPPRRPHRRSTCLHRHPRAISRHQHHHQRRQMGQWLDTLPLVNPI